MCIRDRGCTDHEGARAVHAQIEQRAATAVALGCHSLEQPPCILDQATRHLSMGTAVSAQRVPGRHARRPTMGMLRHGPPAPRAPSGHGRKKWPAGFRRMAVAGN
eukprot:2503885-Rhodomonas_salina.1